MKKFFLILLAIGLTATACIKNGAELPNVIAPIPNSYFDLTSSWTEITTNMFDEDYCVIYNYKLEGDTIINGLRYTKVYLNNELYDAAIRVHDNKVYAYFYDYDKLFAYYPEEMLENLKIYPEKLLYDFNWEIGKTIYHDFYIPMFDSYNYGKDTIIYGYHTEITEMGSVLLLDGNYYKRISSGYYYIQGIGSLEGFFKPLSLLRNANGNQFELLCFSKNGKLLYQNEKYANCYSCEKSNP